MKEISTGGSENSLNLTFSTKKIAVYGEQMIDCAERCSARWQDGQTLDSWREMQRLTLDIVGKTLFSADVAKDDEVGQAMRAATLQYRAFKLPFAKLFERLPPRPLAKTIS